MLYHCAKNLRGELQDCFKVPKILLDELQFCLTVLKFCGVHPPPPPRIPNFLNFANFSDQGNFVRIF